MSESVVGRAVPSTRQNAGTVMGACAPGGVNRPAVIASADLMVTFGIVSAARLAQVVPVDAAGITTAVASGVSATTSAAAKRRVMERPPGPRLYGRAGQVGLVGWERSWVEWARLAEARKDTASEGGSGDGEYHLTLHVPGGHHRQRIGRALERKRRGDVRLQPPFRKPPSQLVHRGQEPLRFTPRELAPEDADDRAALEQRQVQRDLWNVARCEAADQQPSSPRDRAQRELRVRATDRIVDDVGAFAARDRLDPLAQIF